MFKISSKYEGHKIRIFCTDNDIVEGVCVNFVPYYDNEPEIDELEIRNKYNQLIGVTAEEIANVEIID